MFLFFPFHQQAQFCQTLVYFHRTPTICTNWFIQPIFQPIFLFFFSIVPIFFSLPWIHILVIGGTVITNIFTPCFFVCYFSSTRNCLFLEHRVTSEWPDGSFEPWILYEAVGCAGALPRAAPRQRAAKIVIDWLVYHPEQAHITQPSLRLCREEIASLVRGKGISSMMLDEEGSRALN